VKTDGRRYGTKLETHNVRHKAAWCHAEPQEKINENGLQIKKTTRTANPA